MSATRSDRRRGTGTRRLASSMGPACWACIAGAAVAILAMSGCGKCWNGGDIALGVVGGILNPEPETEFDRQWDAHVEANERARCRGR